MRNTFILPLAAFLGCASTVLAESPSTDDPRPAKALQDNSFLIEEAYNQEVGVVQHIVTIQKEVNRVPDSDERNWYFALAQEWPVFSQDHQFSYSVPYARLESGGRSVQGIGDIILNYRYQALYENDSLPAVAPSFSLILPTGSGSKGLGDDTLGYGLKFPGSKIVSDRWTLHANAGFFLFPDLNGRNPVSYSLGASAIYAVTPDFNLMLETIGEWTETVGANHGMEREFEAVLSPGARYAFNLSVGQLVLGIGIPIGLTKAAPDYGVILYFSFEHSFLKD